MFDDGNHKTILLFSNYYLNILPGTLVPEIQAHSFTYFKPLCFYNPSHCLVNFSFKGGSAHSKLNDKICWSTNSWKAEIRKTPFLWNEFYKLWFYNAVEDGFWVWLSNVYTCEKPEEEKRLEKNKDNAFAISSLFNLIHFWKLRRKFFWTNIHS